MIGIIFTFDRVILEIYKLALLYRYIRSYRLEIRHVLIIIAVFINWNM